MACRRFTNWSSITLLCLSLGRQRECRPEARDGTRVRALRLLQEQLLVQSNEPPNPRYHGKSRNPDSPIPGLIRNHCGWELSTPVCRSKKSYRPSSTFGPRKGEAVRPKATSLMNSWVMGKICLLRGEEYMDEYVNPESYIDAQRKKAIEEKRRRRSIRNTERTSCSS